MSTHTPHDPRAPRAPHAPSRRDALSLLARATGLWALNPLLSPLWAPSPLTGAALAQPAPTARAGKHLIYAHFEGGWDLLLGLDPRDPADFPDEAAPETGVEPGYSRLPARYSRAPLDAGPFTLGPCAAPLLPWADRLALVRGVDMGTLTHEVGRRYYNTARPPAGLTAQGSSIATVAAAHLGGDAPIPHLAHRVESYNVDLPSEATALSVASVGHLQYLLQETLGIPSYQPAHIRGALNRYWEDQAALYARRWEELRAAGVMGASDEGAARALARAMSARAQARQLVTASLHESFMFDAPAQASLRARYGITPGQLDTPSGRAALAAQALKVGLSRVVSLTLADGLDTHDGQWANDHSARLEAGFGALAALLGDLADTPSPSGGSGSLLDETVVVVTSEFSRTPRLNARGGRDHHLANAALLAGGGVQGGVTFGLTSPRFMGPLKVSAAGDAADPAGLAVRPEEVMLTALAALGLPAPERVRGQALSPLLRYS
jgi:uncharacterized protein (DUF1501 family)